MTGGTPIKALNIIAVVNDMIFATKIRSTAEAVGVSVSFAKILEELKRLLDDGDVQLVIVDLGLDGGQGIECVSVACSHSPRPRVLAYGSHVDTELADQARAAGADEVMPRSRFNTQLAQILSSSIDGLRARSEIT